ncbi:neo-calmodulin-like isoform X1 [Dreissena polymorpha]|uniref:neo-calmodulin-like isoform X1 n=1 Tax=Dreissena polymorpha TaxID=45954 RepID=UPI002263B704|nr:neo-calmodulin-like isoform X1 [Dreissena polymorpha]XP_052252305.1 neo-calmodulin-like isoform X2 [Dreissena polymorpha]XP_052252306.1 neo-calmodulin-like isoform X1 [Dreissena polymorpha]XP_052252307.1 neo-calmodulin-like isoform X1 [Dreissena polymorpha]
MMTEGISEAQMQELKDAFNLFDKNGDGHISASELGYVLRALGQNPTERMIKEVMAKADKDGNDGIEYNEYVELLKDFLKDPQIVEIELREAFRMFDKDRNNTLNLAELRRALTHLGEPLSEKEAMELCNMMDVNGDQKVDVDEFVQYLCKRI